MVSIYSIPIDSTLGIARHYYLSKDGNFNNSVGWGPAGVERNGTVELTEKELQRVHEYADLFGQYNIHSNNCVRSIKYLEIEKSIVDHLEGNLQKIKQKKLIEQQTARDDFWAKRDAERKQKDNK
jgi:hypothetical protein